MHDFHGAGLERAGRRRRTGHDREFPTRRQYKRTSDVLDLRAFGIDSASTFVQVAVNQGPNVFASLGGGDQIALLGVQVEQFHDDIFRTDLLLV